MERSEPTLVPEWLRSTGSVSGGGNSAHHIASSSQSDVLSSAHPTRNRFSRIVSDKDSLRSAFLDRTSSSNPRRVSSGNDSLKHPYSSFSRSHRDRNRDKEKERSVIGDAWGDDCSDLFGGILNSRAEKDTLRRSRSLVCGKPGVGLPRGTVDLRNGGGSNHNSSNGMLSGGSLASNILKTTFEKDFPSLGNEENQGVPDIGRVSSPGLSTSVQSLPVGNSGLIGGEGWTSALAEVPPILGSSGPGPSSVQQGVPASASSGPSSPMSGLNMAEALSQAPSRAHTTPQLPDKTQRLEELAIKQSRQLIPMTPLVPKSLVASADKLKSKTAVRTSEMIVPAKSVQQQPYSSHLANQSLCAGQVKAEASRSSPAGKFHVLKPVRENGVSSVAKDVHGPNNYATRVANSQLAAASVSPTPSKSPNKSKLSTLEREVAALALNSGSPVEKRPSLSQAQSRSDFFNLMRKKNSTNSSVLPDSGVSVLSSTVEISGEEAKGASAPGSPCVTENGSEVTSNGNTHEVQKDLCIDGAVYPDEEEAAFLRSLGWEENAGEDDGLTEEEINAFYEYMKQRPALKLCSRGMQPKLSMHSASPTTGSGRASSELS